ncbi:MAG: hypothetical protein ACRETM_04635 [Stenotrophobium sp.]
MRYTIFSILLALPLSGCFLHSDEKIPSADGIYSGTIATAGGGTDMIAAVIDSNGHGLIIDTTSPAIYRFTVPKPDNDGNFTSSYTAFASSGFGVSNSTTSSSGTLSGTVVGKAASGIGVHSTTRDKIYGTLNVSGTTGLAFTLDYNSTAYENNALPLATLVGPSKTTGLAPTVKFSYTTTSGASTVTTNVTFDFSGTTQLTSVAGEPYTFTGADDQGCTYTGQISMPSGNNAYELTIKNNCTSATLTGLAEYNPPSGLETGGSLSLEYDDNSSFAVAAANATLKY